MAPGPEPWHTVCLSWTATLHGAAGPAFPSIHVSSCVCSARVRFFDATAEPENRNCARLRYYRRGRGHEVIKEVIKIINNIHFKAPPPPKLVPILTFGVCARLLQSAAITRRSKAAAQTVHVSAELGNGANSLLSTGQRQQ